jgi:RNA recognition motif-containing protein
MSSSAPSEKKKKSEDLVIDNNRVEGNEVSEEKEDEDQSTKTGQNSQHKHILFIGQLSYDTTSAELLEYLKSSGVTGEISVRLLTDKENGRSKGAAFIDLFGGKRSLKRILDLHHTMLKGRRINVEHTSKHGANISETEEHSLKLKQGRMQQKIVESEKIDEVMEKYSHLNLGEKRGILSDDNIMNRLYAMNVQEVTQIFEEYIRDNPGKGKNLSLFYDIVTAHDHGGTAVDQTKDRNRKRKYEESEWRNGDDRLDKRSTGFGQFRAGSQNNDVQWSPGARPIRGGGGRGMRGRGGVMDLFGRGRGGR